MGIYKRGDSRVWWLYLETTKVRERTDIAIGTTVDQIHDSRALALARYYQRMNELATRLYRLPGARAAMRFSKYAATYATDTISHHKGAERERELLKPLEADLGDVLLTALDRDRVQTYMTTRRLAVSARTVNREVDLLKAMLRDAVPKYLDASPLVGMKRLRIVPPKRRLMTPREEQRLLAKADPVERALLILGVDGLGRMGDLLDLRREDRRGSWLYVSDPKGGEPYEIALTKRAAQALSAVRGASPYYFHRYRGAVKDRDRRGRVRRMLQALCARANVPYGRAKNGLTFHWATRKTGATRLVLGRKAPIPVIQRQGNWKTPDVLLKIYAEADREAQRKAFTPRSRARRKSA